MIDDIDLRLQKLWQSHNATGRSLVGVAEAHNPLICAEAHNPAFRCDAGPSVDLASGFDQSAFFRITHWKQRVIAERDELATRLTALQAFIKSDRFSSVEIAEQGRLLRQELIMVDLLAVLNERIAAWGSV